MPVQVVELLLRARADPTALRQATEQLRASINTAAQQAVEAWEASLRAPLARLAGRFESLGRELAMSISAPLALAGTLAGRSFLQFDQTLQQIINLTGVAREEVAGMRDRVLELAGETARSPQELAQALYFLLSSGLDARAALDALEASAKAAAVGLGQTQTVADAVSTVMNAYGQATTDAAQVTALLLAAVREGKAEADAFAGAIGRVVPVAATMGVSFDQVAAALASMTQVGLSTEEAVTALRAIFVDLLNPSKQAEEVLRRYGLTAEQLRQVLRERGLLALLELLRQAFQGNESELSQVLDNVRALTGGLNLMGRDAEQVRGVFERLSKTTRDELGAAFEEVRKSVSFQFAQALAQLATAAVQLGEAMEPGIRALASALRALAGAFRALPEPARAAVVVLGLLAAAAGPVLYAIGRLVQLAAALAGAFRVLAATRIGQVLAQAFGTLATAARGVIPAVARLAPVLQALALPLAALGTAVVSFGTAWTENWLGIRAAVERAAPGVARAVNWVLERLDVGIARLLQFLGLMRRAGGQPQAPEGQTPRAQPLQPPPPPRPPSQEEIEAQRRLAEAVARAQAEILEARGRAFRARLEMIAAEERRIAEQTKNEVLAHEWATAQIQRLREEQHRQLEETLMRSTASITQAMRDQVGSQVLQALQQFNQERQALEELLRNEQLSREDYAAWVAALHRTLELQITDIFAAALEERRRALEQFRSQYEQALRGMLDTEMDIARLRGELAGRAEADILAEQARLIQQQLYNEALSVQFRAQLAARAEQLHARRIQLLRQEADEHRRLMQVIEDLERRRSAILQRQADTEAEIARLRAELAGRTEDEVLRAQAEALQEQLSNERLSLEERVAIARRIEQLQLQRVRALEEEGRGSAALVQAQADLRAAREAELSLLERLRSAQQAAVQAIEEQMGSVRQQLAATQQSQQALAAAMADLQRAQREHLALLQQVQRAQSEALGQIAQQLQQAEAQVRQLGQRWGEWMSALRAGAEQAAQAIWRHLVATLPQQFQQAWLAAIERVRRELRSLDPTVRRSPSLVDRVQAGLAQIRRAYLEAAAAMGRAARQATDGASRRSGPAAGVQLIINGQEISVRPDRVRDLVELLVRDPIQRSRLLRAAAMG